MDTNVTQLTNKIIINFRKLTQGKLYSVNFFKLKNSKQVHIVHVLDLVSQIRDVVLVRCIFNSGNPRGSGFWNGEGMEMGRSVYEHPGTKVDGSYHSKEGSK
jgi:hypothetical protein